MKEETFPVASLEAEQALLGAILVNNRSFDLVSDFLTEDHFSEPLHQHIFAISARAIGMGRIASPKTLIDSLPKELKVGELSGPQYLARLSAEATTIANARDYARIIFEAALQRELQSTAARIIGNVGLGYAGMTIEEQLEAAEEGIAEVRRQLRSNDHTTMTAKDASIAIVEEMKLRRDPEYRRQVPKTGLSDLDKMWGGGLWPGRLLLIAARPGMGKSAMMISLARQVAKQKWGVLIFTLEIDAMEVTARLIASEMSNTSWPIAYRDILVSDDLDNRQQMTIQEGRDRISDLDIVIDHSGGIGMAEIEARARMVKDQMARRGIDLKLVCIDYLGLVKPTERYRGRRVDEIGEIAWGAKLMAKRLEVCTMLLSQLSRDLEKRDDKRPVMSDIRDSGNVEEHSDIIATLYREEYYLQNKKGVDNEKMADAVNKLEVITCKNRIGPTGSTLLSCHIAENDVRGYARY